MPPEEPEARAEPLERPPLDASLLHQLVRHLRENRGALREEWARRITDAQLLRVMTGQEIFSEVTAVYDNYVTALETGSIETLQAYARELSERIIPRGVETDEVLGVVLLLRDVLARSLFANYQSDLPLLDRVLDAYEPAANRIAVTVAVSFVEERERIIREQQAAIRELSTPVLQVRDRLLILPIIGVLDPPRARQLTEQLLGSIRSDLTDGQLLGLREDLSERVGAERIRGIILDVAALDVIDSFVARSLRSLVQAAGLRGAHTVIVGIRPDVAVAMVQFNLNLEALHAVLDVDEALALLDRLTHAGGADA